MMNYGRYFVQFIIWEGIPSSLPFGTDVVLKSGDSIWKWNRNYLCGGNWSIAGFCLLLCCLLYWRDVKLYCSGSLDLSRISRVIGLLEFSDVWKCIISTTLKNCNMKYISVKFNNFQDFHYLRWHVPPSLSCVNAEACLTGWPNAWGHRDGEVS